MPDKSNNPTQFWQELKRRKVFRVIAMYAAAAYVIIELSNNVVEPLSLPPWTTTLIIVLLLIGFPFAVIISWVFDITPEGIKKTESSKLAKQKETPSMPQKRKPGLSDVIIAVLIVVVCVLLYPKIFNKDKFEDIRDTDGRISIAVMPFENQTGDTTLNWFQRGISSLIINGLGSSSELAVRDDHTMYEVMESMDQVFTAGLSQSQAKKVAKKVRAETYISGSCQGRDGKYWILANLVETESGDIIWTSKIEGDLKSSAYLDLADSLCNEIRNYLEIKVLEQEADYDFREAYPKSAEAYRYYIEGMNFIFSNEREPGVESLKKALEIDSTFTLASFFISYAYNMINPQQFEQTLIYLEQAYKTKEKLPVKYRNWLELWYAGYFGKSMEDITHYCDLLAESGINTRLLWFDLGVTYVGFLHQYEKAVNAFEKVMEINLERGDDWKFLGFYYLFLEALHQTGDHDREKEIADIGLDVLPDNSNWFLYRMAICALSQGKTSEANEVLVRYMAKHDELGTSEDNLERFQGQMYEEAHILDQAEIHFRKALELNSQRASNSYELSQFLINNDINADEGVELIRKALVILPENEFLLQWLGWGYYKQGKYEEAVNQLETIWERSQGFNYELYIHLEEAKQALASQN